MMIRYDYQIFTEQQYGGISRYFYELINGFKTYPDVQTQCKVWFSNNIFMEQLQPASGLAKLSFKGKKDAVKWINHIYADLDAWKKNFDIFHPTYYDVASIKRAGKKPMVITIHDLIDERYHNGNKAFQRLIEARRAHIDRADKIIAVSENTKNDLITLCNTHPSKIQVIYHGNTMTTPIPRRSLACPMTTPYLLYTGKRYAYKNFIRFIKAVAPVLQTNPALQVVCGGGGKFTAAERLLFKELNIGSRLVYHSIDSEDTLRQLYNHAELFIYPSEYEGFGFPILEAFNCGCPVVTSYGSSTREIAGDAAAFLIATNESSITTAITQLLFQPIAQEKLVQKGFQRASDFSWERTLAETYAVYRSLLK